MGCDIRYVRKLLDAAGDAPEVAGTIDQWRQVADVAHATVMGALTSGKVRPKDAAVIAAVAERNIRTGEAKSREQSEQLAVDARETFLDWLFDTGVPHHCGSTTTALFLSGAFLGLVVGRSGGYLHGPKTADADFTSVSLLIGSLKCQWQPAPASLNQ
jgi:hypothetical protein